MYCVETKKIIDNILLENFNIKTISIDDNVFNIKKYGLVPRDIMFIISSYMKEKNIPLNKLREFNSENLTFETLYSYCQEHFDLYA